MSRGAHRRPWGMVPPHGPEDGGPVMVIYGRHFPEGRVRAFVVGSMHAMNSSDPRA